jgi:hypothetical protein
MIVIYIERATNIRIKIMKSTDQKNVIIKEIDKMKKEEVFPQEIERDCKYILNWIFQVITSINLNFNNSKAFLKSYQDQYEKTNAESSYDKAMKYVFSKLCKKTL